MVTHSTKECLCPECGTWLLDKQVQLKAYKSCNSCGYARERSAPTPPLIRDDVGDGISPIKTRPELLRPEERK